MESCFTMIRLPLGGVTELQRGDFIGLDLDGLRGIIENVPAFARVSLMISVYQVQHP